MCFCFYQIIGCTCIWNWLNENLVIAKVHLQLLKNDVQILTTFYFDVKEDGCFNNYTVFKTFFTNPDMLTLSYFDIKNIYYENGNTCMSQEFHKNLHFTVYMYRYSVLFFSCKVIPSYKLSYGVYII